MDLIDRQAAIDAVMGEPSDAHYPSWYADVIRNLPSAQPEPHWIPVTEQLPDKDGRYLVTCSKIGAWVVDWNIWHCEPKPGWLWEQGVTAWMPLPEPWEGEENND